MTRKALHMTPIRVCVLAVPREVLNRPRPPGPAPVPVTGVRGARPGGLG